MVESTHNTINDTNGLEYLNNEQYKGSNYFLSFSSLIAFFGGRHVISDLYDNRQDLLCNPFVKITILFSIIYMNIKHFKISIVLFFIYILLIDTYVGNNCDIEYLNDGSQTKKT